MKSADRNELRIRRRPRAVIKIFLEEAFRFREQRAKRRSSATLTREKHPASFVPPHPGSLKSATDSLCSGVMSQGAGEPPLLLPWNLICNSDLGCGDSGKNVFI